MKTNVAKILHRTPRVGFVSTALLFVLASACPASAQWATTDTDNAWTGFNTNFYHTSGSRAWYTNTQGGSSSEGIWHSAEEIEVAVDAYYFAKSFDKNPNLKDYSDRVDALCHGLEYNYGDGDGNGTGGVMNNFGSTFSKDAFNDDLMWITVAFTRAYQITDNATWLTDAKNIFDVVWARARMGTPPDALHNGLGQKQVNSKGDPDYQGAPANPDCPVNYTCVIAGNLLATNGCGAGYKSDADDVWKWAAVPQGNLYTASTGKVPDSITGPTDFSYNYGIAIHAAVLEVDEPTCQNMAAYLMTSFGGSTYQYNSVWNTYNVLPDYTSSENDEGYNGICLRGVGFAQTRGYLTASQVSWAQQNVNAAFFHRNMSSYLMHADWQTATLATGLDSFNCSAALAGMLNIVPQ